MNISGPRRVELEVSVSADNFDERAYLDANPDVAAAVRDGVFTSGRHHYDAHGCHEARRLRTDADTSLLRAAKRKRLEPILRQDLSMHDDGVCFDFLSDEMREAFLDAETDKVSAHGYDRYAEDIITEHASGMVLDCGAGRRPVYYENVVNLEIVRYDTTDVRAVGQALPFQDASFDAVLSLAVLEHVKDPVQCAREISRVLKPGGTLYCVVPFLQPLHGYPSHYYNMTAQGLANLFADELDVERQFVPASGHPIQSLTWMLRSWAAGLQHPAREEFLDLRVRDLVGNPQQHIGRPYSSRLPEEKRFELASCTAMIARRKTDAGTP